jgi:ZIP family zinc transporter
VGASRILEAGGWSDALLGAAAGYELRVPQRVIAAIMASGSGARISALSFDLMEDAYSTGGFRATTFGFLAVASGH